MTSMILCAGTTIASPRFASERSPARATRQTELEESFPSHVVCAWIGNSQRVAREHYLQATESRFQKAVQHTGTQGHVEPREQDDDSENAGDMCGSVAGCGCASAKTMVATGLEPVTSTMSTWRSNQTELSDRGLT